MVISNDGKFELNFIDPFRKYQGKPLQYQHLQISEGICLIGEQDKHFILKLECKDKPVYAVKVIVDGYTMPGKKKFKSKCRIQGFTTPEGNISCFKFQKPKFSAEGDQILKRNKYRPPWDLSINDYRDYPGGPGEIIVKIYETKQEQNKQENNKQENNKQEKNKQEKNKQEENKAIGGGEGGGAPRQKKDPVFQEVDLNEGKQIEDQCLIITKRNIIELPPKQPFDDPRPPNPFKNVIDYTQLIQSFRIIYLDAQSLVDKGIVKLSLHNHIRYLNEEFLQGNEAAMIQVLQTLIESGQRNK